MPRVTKEFVAEGMMCEGCEEIIQDAVSGLPGVESISADYASERVRVTFDPAKTQFHEITHAVDAKGYRCRFRPRARRGGITRALAVLAGLALIGGILYLDSRLMNDSDLPKISPDMSYGLLFLVGFLTGFHCVGMCGAFIVGYTADSAVRGEKSYFSHILYGLGKTLSYAAIGAAFGWLGSFVAFTPFLRGLAAALAGLFLVLYGMKMLDLIPGLRRFGFRTPKFLQRFFRRHSATHSHPFVIGLLNGLMIACAPLQAMYVMAAGTGSALEGAKLLTLFGLGTLPVLFGFGLVASMISGHATQRILKASGFIVVVLGAIMVNRGMIMTGSGYDAKSLYLKVRLELESFREAVTEWRRTPEVQEIRMEVTAEGYVPDTFILVKGVPVKWVIDAKQLTGCNRAIVVPQLGLEFELEQGIQVIEFTPRETGVIPWSCWMGMIPGSFVVREEMPKKAQSSAPAKD